MTITHDEMQNKGNLKMTETTIAIEKTLQAENFTRLKKNRDALAQVAIFLINDPVHHCGCLKCEVKRELLCAMPQHVADYTTSSNLLSKAVTFSLLATVERIDQAFSALGEKAKLSHEQGLLIDHDAMPEIPF